MCYGVTPINTNVACPGAKGHSAAAAEPLSLAAAGADAAAPAPARVAAAVATVALRTAAAGQGFRSVRARMTSLLAAADAAGAGELCRGRLVAACNDIEHILQAHAAAPGAAATLRLQSSAAAAALPDTVRRFRSSLDTGAHRSSGVAPPPPAPGGAGAATFSFAAKAKAPKKRKHAAATPAVQALVAESEARWAAAEAAGVVVHKAKRLKASAAP